MTKDPRDSQDHELEGSYALTLRDENAALRNKLLETSLELLKLRELLGAKTPPPFRKPPDETL